MIYYNSNIINDWNFGDDNIIKVYKHGAVCYYKITSGDTPTPVQEPCFAVVDDITQYSDTEFEDVYDKATEKWYKLNNLNQYEEYGIYGNGRSVTTYNGKLTIDDGYEYEWNGSSWVNLGEVSGSTASLPDIPFVLNYNAKQYNASTHSIPMTTGQLNDTDAVAYNYPNNIVDHSADGYITISNSSMRIRKQGQDISLFNRSSNSTSSDLTIVCKAKSTSGENIITNRDSNYNWMYRLKTSGQLRFHGTSETGSIAWNISNPDIMSVRTYYSSGTKLKYNNWTQNTSTTPTSFTYGSTNNDSGTAGALFVGYGWNNTNEQWSGDFYWVYMAQANLTDAQIQEVIDYNEGGGGEPEYPKYYDEIQDPPDNLVFSSMAEAEAYECPWVGMSATIDGDRYVFSGDSQSGYEWVYNPSRLPVGYTEVEYVENTSTAYINTEVLLYDSATNSYNIQCKCYFQPYGNDFEYLFGTEGTSSPYVGVILRYYQRNILYTSNPDNVLWTHIDNSDGTSGITASCSSTTATNGNNPLTLFCGLWSTGPWRNGRGKIYSFKVTKNGTLVRDLVPAKRDSDSKYGMYDIVNDVFYVSPNGNNFSGGDPV